MCLKYLFLFLLVSIISAKCLNGGMESPDSKTCYKFYGAGLNFFDAENNCENAGGHLTSITSAFINSFIATRAKEIMQDLQVQVRLGASLSNQTWNWIDGNPFSYKNWAPGQPDGKGKCITMSPLSEQWYSSDCQEQLPYFCEYTNTDATPAPVCKVQPLCDSEWTYFEPTKYCYKTFKIVTVWDVAESICVSNYSHLASIHNIDENNFLSDFTRTGMTVPMENVTYSWEVWIGLNRQSDQNMDFQWSDGTPYGFNNWVPTEPSIGYDERKTALFVDLSANYTDNIDHYQKWFTKNTHATMRAFVCKKPSNSFCSDK